MPDSGTVIISFAKRGREDYPSALPRLVDSAKNNGYRGDFILVSPGGPESFCGEPNRTDIIGSIPDHSVIPYGFKPSLVKIAKDLGYKKVIWFDSTIVCTAPFVRLQEVLKWSGVMSFDNPGCPGGYWTSDDCFEAMGCTSTDEMNAYNQCMACVLGFNFTDPVAEEIFNKWYSLMNDGISFKGASGSSRKEFVAHRHDQSVISYLCFKKGILKLPYGILTYWDDRHKFKDSVLICNRGIGQP